MVLPTWTTAPPRSEASSAYLARTFLPVNFMISASNIIFLAVAQLAGAADLRFYEALALVQFLLQLLQDFAEQRQPVMIDQDSDKISHLPDRTEASGDGVENGALAITWDRGIV